jgi:hypothetical protein
MVVLKKIMSNSNAIYMECQNEHITSILKKTLRQLQLASTRLVAILGHDGQALMSCLTSFFPISPIQCLWARDWLSLASKQGDNTLQLKNGVSK